MHKLFAMLTIAALFALPLAGCAGDSSPTVDDGPVAPAEDTNTTVN